MADQRPSPDILEQTKDPEYEKAFKAKHQRLSTLSSVFFALAGATFIGVLGAFSSKLLGAAEQGNPLFRKKEGAPVPIFHNKRFMLTSGAMAGIGGFFMYLSNKLETLKTIYEDRRLAHLIDRRTPAAEPEPATAPSSAEEEPSSGWRQRVAAERQQQPPSQQR